MSLVDIMFLCTNEKCKVYQKPLSVFDIVVREKEDNNMIFKCMECDTDLVELFRTA